MLTLPQVILLVAVLIALFIALDLNNRARAGQRVGAGEETLQQEVTLATTRQVELQATLDYVQSDDYVAAYARDEGGQLLPGEIRVVPLPIEATPAPPTAPVAHTRPGARRPTLAGLVALTNRCPATAQMNHPSSDTNRFP